MYQLLLLGPPRVVAPDGGDVTALLRQPKRLALLAYLASARPRGPQRRDKLLPLFWPESDDTHARAALSQALYVLRHALGDRAILTPADTVVALDPAIVACDASDFDTAIDGSRPLDALSIYRGDFLDGFHVDASADFEQWLDGERAHFRQRAADGAWSIAEAKAGAGDAIEAARWARRAADLLPADEASIRRLMTFLAGLGDRTAAIRAYDAFAYRLAAELEVEPSAETTALATAIRAADRRAIAPPTLPRRDWPIWAGLLARWPRARVSLSVGVTTVAITFGAVAWGSRLMDATEDPSVAVFSLDFGGIVPFNSGPTGATLVLSPDAKHLVYVGEKDGIRQLFVRSMDRLDVAPIPGSQEALHPFFSPDGARIGFLIRDEIRTVPIDGGPAVVVCRVKSTVAGLSWGTNGEIVFAEAAAGLWTVPARGGVPRLVVAADTANGERLRFPTILPDGRTVLVTRIRPGGLEIARASLVTGALESVGLEGTDPRYVPPGYLLFARLDGTLFGVRFDPRTLEPIGLPSAIARGVLVGIGGKANAGYSNDGTLVYAPDPPAGPLVIVDRAGRVIDTLRGVPSGAGGSRFSPDGRRLAMVVGREGSASDIWMVDLDAAAARRVTFDSGTIGPAIWSPDGRRLAVATKPGSRDFGFLIRLVSIDDSAASQTFLPGHARQLPIAFTPDERSLVFQRFNAETLGDLWIAPLDAPRAARPLVRTSADERDGALSPDGRWIAFVSDASGRDEVYVRSFNRTDPPLRVSVDGGREVRWSHRGLELFYSSPRGLVAATIDTGATLGVRSRTLLFTLSPRVSGWASAAYDVHPDGDRFVMVQRGATGDAVLMLNWLEKLRGR